MNKKFVTEAIRDDRCLKAHRLLDRFETELRAELKRLGEEIVEANPHLLEGDAGSNIRVSWDSGTILANARDNIEMSRVNESQPTGTQKLNISLRWVDPIDWGECDVDGALCAACYKINGGNRDDFADVKQDTGRQDWNISFGEDQFNNSPGILYIPVESGEELREANETIRNHFTEFGDYWGVEPSELDTNS